MTALISEYYESMLLSELADELREEGERGVVAFRVTGVN
jgi:hypothetical protein